MVNSPKDFIQFIQTGWIEVGRTRMCLLEIENGFYKLRRNLRNFVGPHEKELIYKAGIEASAEFMHNSMESKLLTPDKNGFVAALGAYSAAGFGNFTLLKSDWKKFQASIEGQDAFEGWAFKKRHDFTDECGCDYSRGVLAGFMLFSHLPTQDELDQVICLETQCLAKGDPQCHFEIGFKDNLKKRGLAIPPSVRSHQEELEIALGRAQQALNKKKEEMIKLLYNLTHDLKSPLISIHGFANLLLEGEKKIDEKERRHLLQRILANSETMEQMIQELLDLYSQKQEESA